MPQHRIFSWRSNKLRLTVGIVCGLLFIKYIFGYSVYTITTRIYQSITVTIYGSHIVAVSDETPHFIGKLPTSNHSSHKFVSSPTDLSVKRGNSLPSNSLYMNSNFTRDIKAAITVGNKTLSTHLSLGKCPLLPPGLVGPIQVNSGSSTMAEIESLNPQLKPGGHGMPENCMSRHKVAIIIPFRNRWEQLQIFLQNIHTFLTKQQLDYAIFAIEQIDNQTFNRAKLMNVGFVEALGHYNWSCFIFHDVDLLPQDDRNIYACPEQPRHMSVAIEKFNYRLTYPTLFGGVTALTTEQFYRLNGFSNDFWGWGGEDDEMSSRLKLAGYSISRYPADIARYTMIKHIREATNPVNRCRYNLMYKVNQRWQRDGLTSLKYRVVRRHLHKLITVVKVDLLEKESHRMLDAEGICRKITFGRFVLL